MSQQLSKEELFAQILRKSEVDFNGAITQLVEAFNLNHSESYSSQMERQLKRNLTKHEKAKIEFADESDTLRRRLSDIDKMELGGESNTFWGWLSDIFKRIS